MYKEIFLVDDEELINTINAIQFRKLGLEDYVRSFTNPELALDYLRFRANPKERVIVFLDINMPEMSGFEFLEFMYLENFPPNIDVVIVTSSINEVDRKMAENFKKYVRGFINKPLKMEDIKQLFKNDLPNPETITVTV